MPLWTPAEATTGLWLDASDSSTITSSPGVTEWRDKSGNDFHMVPLGGSTREPSVISAGLNGLDVLGFNYDQLYSGSAIAPHSGDWTAVIVAKTNNLALSNGQRILVQFDEPTSTDYAVYGSIKRDWADGAWRTTAHSSVTDTNSTVRFGQAGSVTLSPAIFSTSYSTTTKLLNVYLNGVQGGGATAPSTVDLGAATARTGASTYQVGGWYLYGSLYTPLVGYIAEIILVPSTLSDADRQMFEGYVAHKWGLTDELPADHLYKSYAPGEDPPDSSTQVDTAIVLPAPVINSNVSLTDGIGANLALPSPIISSEVELTYPLQREADVVLKSRAPRILSSVENAWDGGGGGGSIEPWTPAVISTSLWLKKGNWIAGGDNKVEQMTDLSTNERHFIQPTWASRPVINANGDLDTTGGKWLYNQTPVVASLASTVGVMVFMVVSSTPSSGTVFSETTVGITTPRYSLFDQFNGAAVALIIGSDGTYGSLRGVISPALGYAKSLYCHTDVTQTITGRFNGTVYWATPFSYPVPGGNLDVNLSSLGGLTYGLTFLNNNAPIQLSELIVVPYDADYIEIIEGYLAHEHGLQGLLPVGHLYKDAPPTYEVPADGAEARLVLPKISVSSTVTNESIGLWTPEEVEKALWLDADDLGTFTLDFEGEVIEWRDKSGYHRHARAVDEYRPQLFPDIQNGRSVVRIGFTAADKLLLSETGGNSIARNTGALSIFVVATSGLGDTAAVFKTTLPTSDTSLAEVGPYNGTNVLARGTPVNTEGSEYVTASSITLNKFYQYAGLFDFVGQTVSILLFGDAGTAFNQAFYGVSTFTADSDSQDTCIGSLEGDWDDLAGDIAEIIIVRDILDDIRRTRIEGYLAWKWGIVENLPEDHPYKLAAPTPDPPPEHIDTAFVLHVPSISSQGINYSPISGYIDTTVVLTKPAPASFIENPSNLDWLTHFYVHSDTFPGDTVFIDQSLHSISIQTIGDAHHSDGDGFGGYEDGDPLFEGTSIFSTETGGYLHVGPSPKLALGQSDFTVDFWLTTDSLTDGSRVCGYASASAGFILKWIRDDNLWKLQYESPHGSIITQAMAGTWFHVAIVRVDLTVYLYLDGIRTVVNGFIPPIGTVYDDRDITGEYFYIGYGDCNLLFDRFRISKYARWLTDFEPPTELYTTDPKMNGHLVLPRPGTTSLITNTLGPKVFTHCVPWRVQPWNDTQGGTFGSSVADPNLLPETRTQGHVFVTGSKVYIIGGQPPDGGPSTPALIADINPDGSIGPWSTDPWMGYGVYGGRSFITIDKAYLVGGKNHLGATPAVTGYLINPDGTLSDERISAPSMLEHRNGPGLVVTKNRVYVFGGYNLGPFFGTGAPVKSTEYAEIYPDGSLSPWQWGPDMPHEVSGAAAVYTGTKVYVFGSYLFYAGGQRVMSADVDSDGVVSNWVDEVALGVNPTDITGYPLIVQTKDYVFVVSSGSLYGTINATVVIPILPDGTLDFANRSYTTLIDALTTWGVFGNHIFVTGSRLYSAGGYKPDITIVSDDDGTTTYYDSPIPVNTVHYVPFAGGYNEYPVSLYWVDGELPPDIIGTLDLNITPLSAELQAREARIGQVEAEFSVMGMEGVVFSNLVSSVTEPLTATWYSGASVSLTIPMPVCRMGQGYLLAGDLPAFNCQAFSEYRSKNMDNCLFREPTMTALGSNNYTFMDARLLEMEMDAIIGNGLECEMEALGASCSGAAGLVGGMDCRSLRMTAELTVPVPITFIAEMPPLELQAYGGQPLRATLTLPFQVMSGEIQGTTGIYSELDTRLPLLSFAGAASAHPVAALIADFLVLQYSAAVISEVGGINMDVEFDRLSLLASLSTDGPNGIDVTFPPIGGGFVEDRETCALAATLSYEVTL